MTSPLIGLKDLHFSILLEETMTTASYDLPKKLANSINAKISVATNSATLYADDAPIVTSNSIGEISLEIEVDALDNADVVKLLGITKNADGVLEYNASAQAPEVAIGFRSKKQNGKYKYIWLLKGVFALPEDEFKTLEDKTSFQTRKLKATFIIRQDGNWKYEVDEDDLSVAPNVISDWFTSVYKSTPAA